MLRSTAGQAGVELVHKELRRFTSDHLSLVERAKRIATDAATKYEKKG
jgi:hypothetical protein